MFRRLAPQVVRHTSGFVVRVASREFVELVEVDGAIARVEVEFGPICAIYRSSLTRVDSKGREAVVLNEEREALVALIKAGLEAMGGPCEVL